MKTPLLPLLFFLTLLIPTSQAAESDLFPLELFIDTGYEQIYRFYPDNQYTLKVLPNEARGFEGITEKGTYTFKPSKNGGTIIMKSGHKIRFQLPKIPAAGQSVNATGMIYDPSGTPRFREDMTIPIKNLSPK